jgi:hypothetical protein
MNIIPSGSIDNVNYLTREMALGGGLTPAKYATSGRKVSLLNKFKEAGWTQASLKKRFKTLNDNMMIYNDRDEDLVRAFSDNWYENQGFDETIEKTLLNMGVSSRSAKRADYAISPLLNTSYTYSQIMRIAVKYLLGHYKPISPDNVSHFYSPDILNVWIPYDLKDVKYQVMNVPYSCSITVYPQMEVILKKIIKKDNHTLFFHTTSWLNCIRILRQINHMKGHECQDFGVTPSFYMSDTIYNALEWGYLLRNKFSNEIGTVIFSLPRTFPKYLKYKELKDDEWNSGVVKSRQCVSLDEYEYNISEVENYDFIYGNMLANPQIVKEGGAPRTHKPPKNQLASKSGNSDKFLQKHIIGCIFFSKSGGII